MNELRLKYPVRMMRPPFQLPIPVTGRWRVVLGEPHALLVNGYRHMFVLVSVDSDDHLNCANDFGTGDC